MWGTRVAGAAIPPGLHGVAFNASLCVSATPAVLFRLIEETRPTLLVDEAEALDTDNRRVEFFDMFTPIALAGIRGLHATTEDRCIALVMPRGADRARVNASEAGRHGAHQRSRSFAELKGTPSPAPRL